MNFLTNFLKDEQGQDLIEYALLMAFVALGAVALLTGLGGSISNMFGKTNNTLSSAVASGS